jgi:cytochrome c2
MRKVWRTIWIVLGVLVVVVLIAIAAIVININKGLRAKHDLIGKIKDEAASAGRTPESLPGADEDYYADMDYGATKDPEGLRKALDPFLPGISAQEAVRRVVIGRNNWVVWTAGNDRLWDKLSVASVGNLDLLKTISDHPAVKWTRDQRWYWYGLVNEPCFRKGTGPRADRFGLWLDERVTGGDCKPDPFENEDKYPGVKIGARGTGKLPVGSYYGYATGVVGLRLFPNPDFDAAAQQRWDPVRYYTDPTYYNDAKLVKPYRVGMSCGFCHVGPNPTNPPADPENPKWENLSSNPGAQYFWIDRVFMFDTDRKSFVWQLFHTSRPGALDTSLVSSDQINNPRTMNAIYNLAARLEIGRRWGVEQLKGGSDNNKQFNDYVPPNTYLASLYDPKTKEVRTTHVLKDGSDAVGALGALNRVYINIGLDSEEWLLHFFPLIGGASLPYTQVSPIAIADMEKNSTYWKANELQTPNTALFFLATAKPDLLKNAPGGPDYLAKDAALLPRGKEVFAERCARCHSSKQPEKAFANYFKPGCVGPNYLQCWNDFWQYSKTDEYKTAMKGIVNAPDFLDNNFLSTEIRVPATLLETNSCSPLATNAIRNNIWDNFSSESYKDLPSVGKILVHDPYTGKPWEYQMPAGGRGYTRPASLVSLWSTAPYFQNNALGTFYWKGDVPGRIASFEDSITKLLWPEKRESNGMFMTRSGKLAPGWIDRTTERSYLNVAPGYLPSFLASALADGFLEKLLPNVFHKGGVRLGPIPKGTPVNLLADMNLEETGKALKVVAKLNHDLKKLPANATDEEANKQFANVKDDLIAVCKCPDFVVNRGHYFGTDYLPASEGEPGLSDDDKKALIAFLKTM